MTIGQTYTSSQTVSKCLLANHIGSGDMPVLGTPAMMALMENAAMLCVARDLPEGDTTVGSYIETSHLCPTAEGQAITAKATLTAIEGRKLSFKISAHQGDTLLGEGTHTRFIVNKEKFLKKL